MRYVMIFLVAMTLTIANAMAQPEPVPCDPCPGYPEGAFMTSGGPELGGAVHRLSCRTGTWEDMDVNEGDPCYGCHPAPGLICNDGTIYGGLSPDGQGAFFTTPANLGNFTWNDGSTNYVDLPAVHCGSGAACYDGAANTAYLTGLSGSGSPAPYRAAEACANLSGAAGHGHDDWYLPARDEMAVLCANRDQGALASSFSMPYYWTSSQDWVTAGRYLDCDGGTGGGSGAKHFSNRVRCIRR